MRRVSMGFAVAAGLLGCGDAVHLETDAGEGANRADADVPLGNPPSIVASDATPPAASCPPCTSNDDCGTSGAACVASDGPSHGYCAPGCNKEGYCTPDRACARVSDPNGLTWSACLPVGGCERD